MHDMADALIQRKRHESEQEILLRLLEHVDTENSVSQGGFANKVGIAKGLANAYFNRCLKKGWIKLRQAPRQRYLYYLTPKGFAEKARLTAQFLNHSFQFYRDARAEFVAVLAEANEKGHERAVVIGSSELAEIAAIVSDQVPVAIIGFVDHKSERATLAGWPVTKSLAELGDADSAILATLEDTREVYRQFRRENSDIPVFVPPQLTALVG